MKLSAQSHASIVSSLQEAIDKFIADGEKTVVTDIHLQMEMIFMPLPNGF